jgi:LmbE family N-acetylglucosaminyl deacetylase
MDAVTRTLPGRRIEGRGTPEAEWQADPRMASLDRAALEELLPPGKRPLVVAPHPDDELIGCGGLLAQWRPRLGERPVLVIGATDGEAAYPDSSYWKPKVLARVRAEERLVGLHQLGVPVDVESAGIPDGQVARFEDALRRLLLDRVTPDDVLLATWEFDGHPDHEACGRVAAQVARERGCALLQMPVWAWHWAEPGDARVPWRDLRRFDFPDRALSRKARALGMHASQLHPDDGSDPVLAPWATARMLRTFETFIVREPR